MTERTPPWKQTLSDLPTPASTSAAADTTLKIDAEGAQASRATRGSLMPSPAPVGSSVRRPARARTRPSVAVTTTAPRGARARRSTFSTTAWIAGSIVRIAVRPSLIGAR